jgi:hypothetical protein
MTDQEKLLYAKALEIAAIIIGPCEKINERINGKKADLMIKLQDYYSLARVILHEIC